MLTILKAYIDHSSPERKNDIIIDFYHYLIELDYNINKYLVINLEDWKSQYCWQGFYIALQQEFNDGNWEHVNNPAGGFWGYSWHWKVIPETDCRFRFYLQLEQKKLVVKVNVNSTEKNICNQIRYALQAILFDEANRHNIDIKKSGRYGKYMTIALVTEDYRQSNLDGTLNLSATIDYLKKVMTLLDSTYHRALTDI